MNYSTTSSTSDVWYNWTSTTDTTTTIWSDNTTIWSNIYTYTNYWTSWQAPQNVIIRNSDRVRERELQEQFKERKKQEIEAKAKAEQLLLENLTEEQREMYKKLKKFHIISEEGKRYELDCTKKWHNVYELDKKGKRKVEHCIYTPGVPLGDNHLAQKLLLETNEKEFKRIANQTQIIRA